MKKTSCHTEKMYRQHGKQLLALIRTRVYNTQDAQDILQETFLKFERCCQKKCECNHPKSYLFRIGLNATTDFFYKKKREKKMLNTWESPMKTAATTPEFPCEILSCTYHFLSEVSPANRAAFIQSEIEGKPQKQIAEELGVPYSTLKSRIQRTRNTLKTAFKNCLNQNEYPSNVRLF